MNHRSSEWIGWCAVEEAQLLPFVFFWIPYSPQGYLSMPGPFKKKKAWFSSRPFLRGSFDERRGIAMTRSRQSIFITWSKVRMSRGETFAKQGDKKKAPKYQSRGTRRKKPNKFLCTNKNGIWTIKKTGRHRRRDVCWQIDVCNGRLGAR